jgi:hypothetical protein
MIEDSHLAGSLVERRGKLYSKLENYKPRSINSVPILSMSIARSHYSTQTRLSMRSYRTHGNTTDPGISNTVR